MAPSFDPQRWLAGLTEIGGGYALASGRLLLSVDHCDDAELTSVMAQVVGQSDRQDAIKRAIQKRQNGLVQ